MNKNIVTHMVVEIMSLMVKVKVENYWVFLFKISRERLNFNEVETDVAAKFDYVM